MQSEIAFRNQTLAQASSSFHSSLSPARPRLCYTLPDSDGCQSGAYAADLAPL